MGLTNGARVTAGTAATILTIGVSVVLYSTLHNDPSRVLLGTCITLSALTVIALILIRHWIGDTSEERRLLAASQREAQAERSRYFAAQAALEVEQGRLTVDRSTQLRADTKRLQVEREKMTADFEERRAALVSETIEEVVSMIVNGKLAPESPTENKVIQFPHQHSHPQPERARSREHGVVSP